MIVRYNDNHIQDFRSYRAIRVKSENYIRDAEFLDVTIQSVILQARGLTRAIAISQGFEWVSTPPPATDGYAKVNNYNFTFDKDAM